MKLSSKTSWIISALAALIGAAVAAVILVRKFSCRNSEEYVECYDCDQLDDLDQEDEAVEE